MRRLAQSTVTGTPLVDRLRPGHASGAGRVAGSLVVTLSPRSGSGPVGPTKASTTAKYVPAGRSGTRRAAVDPRAQRVRVLASTPHSVKSSTKTSPPPRGRLALRVRSRGAARVKRKTASVEALT